MYWPDGAESNISLTARDIPAFSIPPPAVSQSRFSPNVAFMWAFSPATTSSGVQAMSAARRPPLPASTVDGKVSTGRPAARSQKTRAEACAVASCDGVAVAWERNSVGKNGYLQH